MNDREKEREWDRGGDWEWDEEWESQKTENVEVNFTSAFVATQMREKYYARDMNVR